MCSSDFGSDHNKFETHLVSKLCMNKDNIVEINDQDRYQCDLCERSYAHKDELNRHIGWKHMTTAKEFKCKDCEASFLYKSSLKRHRKKAHGES